jgi:hypothetical protein
MSVGSVTGVTGPASVVYIDPKSLESYHRARFFSDLGVHFPPPGRSVF